MGNNQKQIKTIEKKKKKTTNKATHNISGLLNIQANLNLKNTENDDFPGKP